MGGFRGNAKQRAQLSSSIFAKSPRGCNLPQYILYLAVSGSETSWINNSVRLHVVFCCHSEPWDCGILHDTSLMWSCDRTEVIYVTRVPEKKKKKKGAHYRVVPLPWARRLWRLHFILCVFLLSFEARSKRVSRPSAYQFPVLFLSLWIACFHRRTKLGGKLHKETWYQYSTLGWVLNIRLSIINRVPSA